MTDEEELVGTVVDGAYRVERQIARGGSSSVYRAERIDDGERVALKVLHLASDVDMMMSERFTREARLVSTLTSPYTVRIYGWGQVGHTYLYTAMEYIAGRSLRRQIKKNGPLTARQAAELAVQICESLIEAHENGFLHRDLKPSNVMIFRGDDGRVVVKLLDFGAAKILDVESEEVRGHVTLKGLFVGTPRYASPEQFRQEPLTPATDVYGVGMILWEALVGEPAVSENTFSAALKGHLDDGPWRLPEKAACAPDFAAIVEKALAKAADQRYESCVELKLALDDWLGARFPQTKHGRLPDAEPQAVDESETPGREGEVVAKKEKQQRESLADVAAKDELFGEVIESASESDARMEIMDAHDLSESSAARASRLQIANRNTAHAGVDDEDRAAAAPPAPESGPSPALIVGLLVVAVLAGLYVFTMGSNEPAVVTDPAAVAAAEANANAKVVVPVAPDSEKGDGSPTLDAQTIIKSFVASGWRVSGKSTDKMDEVVQTNILVEKADLAASVVIYESGTWEWADQLKLTTEPPVQAVGFGRTIVRIAPGPTTKSNGVIDARASLDEFKTQAVEKLAQP